MKTIELLISGTGDVRITTKGFAGSTCQLASRYLESALGTCEQESLTAEYFHEQPLAACEQESQR